MSSKILSNDFFTKETSLVAQNLLCKKLIWNGFEGIITETEAYFGDDEASHGARGKTKRNEAMFLTAGHIYVYLIYGMYYCLNIVTEAKGYPSAVLIRGLYLEKEKIHLDGPGKLCRHLNIDLSLNKERLNQSMFIKGNSFLPKFDTTVRIGISKAKDKLLRFVMTKSSLNDYLCNKL